jgi:flagellar hook-basal body complex protein FliE
MALDPLQNKIREMALEQARATEEQQGENTKAAGGFDQLLGRLVTDVDSLQKTAETTISDLAGNAGGVEDVSKKMQEADAAYNLMMQIRHKLVDVYSAVEKKSGEQ